MNADEMLRMMRCRIGSGILLAIITIAVPCAACAIIPDFRTVGPSFRVKVEDRGRPVQGLQIEIAGDRENSIRAITGKDGLALFRNVRPGLYYLQAARDAGISAGYGVEVKTNGPANVIVPFSWPHAEPVVARSLKGTVHLPDVIPGQTTQRTLSLDLLEGISGRKLNTVETNGNGDFDLTIRRPDFISLISIES